MIKRNKNTADYFILKNKCIKITYRAENQNLVVYLCMQEYFNLKSVEISFDYFKQTTPLLVQLLNLLVQHDISSDLAHSF